MRRREFIAGLGSSAVWPLATSGQQAAPLLGFLLSGAPPFPPVLGAAFHRGLNEFRYAEHVNVRIQIVGSGAFRRTTHKIRDALVVKFGL
jgi:hypothetical protein